MAFIKVNIHFVWCTKNREPFLDSFELRNRFWHHIKGNSIQKGIFIDTINGFEEHCHCLISLGINQTMSKITQLLKGESSYWINKHNLCKGKFEWQNEYFAISVSESRLDTVREYIRNQESHHRNKSFQQEYNELMEKYGFKQLKDEY